MPRVNVTVTVASGTPVNVGAALGFGSGEQCRAQRVFVQALPASSGGLVYVMDGIGNGRTPSSSASIDVTAVLAAATATAPGGSYSDTADPDGPGYIDLKEFWIDGSHTTDTVKVSAYLQ